MGDLDTLKQMLERQGQEAQEFQRAVMDRLTPPEKDRRTPAEMLRDGYADTEAARKEGGDDDGA
jgi:hypothetical protein